MQEVEGGKEARQIYPRITALVISASPAGNVNAAPYSWVAPVSFVPPMLYVGIQRRETLTVKNIRATKEFVVNIVTREWAQEAVNCEAKDPEKVEKSGVKMRDSKKVKPPTAAQARLALECRLKDIVEEGDHYLVIGEIVHAEKDPELKTGDLAMHVGGTKFVSPGKEFDLERRK